MGHSASTTNVCVSASKDNTVIVWNYLTGDLLRTFLLPSTPLCLALDPCDRGVYIGFEDGSTQIIEFLDPNSTLNSLFDTRLQNTPLQITLSPWIAPSDVGAVLCLGLSYDGTSLLSGHASGKIVQWDTGRRSFSGEIADLNAPVTNILMQSPFPERKMTKTFTVVKPKLGESAYTFVAQLTGTLGSTSSFEKALTGPGLPPEMLDDAISRLARPAAFSSSADEQLRQENAELWKVIHEQRALQKKTWEKYSRLKSGGS
jgi:pre-rRNA-processing protein IPI3